LRHQTSWAAALCFSSTAVVGLPQGVCPTRYHSNRQAQGMPRTPTWIHFAGAVNTQLRFRISGVVVRGHRGFPHTHCTHRTRTPHTHAHGRSFPSLPIFVCIHFARTHSLHANREQQQSFRRCTAPHYTLPPLRLPRAATHYKPFQICAITLPYISLNGENCTHFAMAPTHSTNGRVQLMPFRGAFHT